jgi:hypothetical protein
MGLIKAVVSNDEQRQFARDSLNYHLQHDWCRWSSESIWISFTGDDKEVYISLARMIRKFAYPRRG